LSLSPIPFGVSSVLPCAGGWIDFGVGQEPFQAQSSTSSVAMSGTSSTPLWTPGIQRARGSQLGLDGLPLDCDPICGDYLNSSRGLATGPVEMVWRTIPEMGGNYLCGTCALSAGTRLDRDTPRES